MRLGLSPFRRSAENAALDSEESWQGLYQDSKLNLWTLLRGTAGSRRAAEKAFEQAFVIYAKECVKNQTTPSPEALLRRVVQWIRTERRAVGPPDTDLDRAMMRLPTESRLAFIAIYALGLDPVEAEELLQKPRGEILRQAVSGLRTIREVQKARTFRR